jgi:hypothetical protein
MARSELPHPLNADQTVLPFPIFWLSPREEQFFCWDVWFQHSLFSLTSGNVLTLENYKNCPPRVCGHNPTEVPQVLSLLMQFCVRIQTGCQFHALPCINYERTNISCSGFTQLVRLYPKLCSIQRNSAWKTAFPQGQRLIYNNILVWEVQILEFFVQVLNNWINFEKYGKKIILICFGTINEMKKSNNEPQG